MIRLFALRRRLSCRLPIPREETFFPSQWQRKGLYRCRTIRFLALDLVSRLVSVEIMPVEYPRERDTVRASLRVCAGQWIGELPGRACLRLNWIHLRLRYPLSTDGIQIIHALLALEFAMNGRCQELDLEAESVPR